MSEEIRFRLAVDGAQQVSQGINAVDASLAGLPPRAAVAGQKISDALSRLPAAAQVSAAQTAAAWRQLPMQLQDVAVSLQGGMNPFTVLMQQGPQITSSFGGVRATMAAVASAVPPVAAGLAGVAAAGVAVGVAAFQGSREMSTLSMVLIETGNQIGLTSGRLGTMAQRLDDIDGVTRGQATEALALLAGQSGITAAGIERITGVALRLQAAGGAAVEETAKRFADLGREPLQAAIKLHEQTGFLTASVYQQIRALDEQGRTAEAARVAQEAYASALESRIPAVAESLGTLERAWLGITGVAREAWDAMKGVGRADSTEDRLAAAKQRLTELRERASKGRGLYGSQYAMTSEGLRELTGVLALQEAEVKRLQAAKDFDDVMAQQRQRAASATKALVAWDQQGTQYLSNQARAAQEVARAREAGAAAGRSQAEIEARVAAIRTKYADKPAPKSSADAFAAERDAARQWADAVSDFAKAEQAAQAAGEGLNATQARLVAYLTSPAYAQHSDAMRQIVVQKYAAAAAAEQLAAAEKLAADAIRAASGSADTALARVQAMEDEERAALLAAGGLMHLAQATEAVAIARLRDAQAQALSLGDEDRAAAIQREIEARQRLMELTGRKEARESVQRGAEKGQADSQRRLESYLNRDIGTDLSAGFDKASQSLGQFVQQFARLNDEQSAYRQAQRDARGDVDKMVEVESRHAQAQISSYAAMAGAAKGFFKEGSTGYRAMAATEKAFRAVQLASAVATAARQIGLIGSVTAAKVTADATMATSDTARAGVEQGNSFITAAAKGAEAVVNAIRSLPFPANLAAGAATAAAVAALGVRLLGGGGGNGSRPSNSGTGTVLGDPKAQSESIGNSTARLEQVNTQTMRYSAQMLASLRSIDSHISGLASLLVRTGTTQGLSSGLTSTGTGALASIGKGVADIFTLGALPALGNAVARLVGGRSRVTGEGVTFGAQTLGGVRASGSLTGEAYVNYRQKKNFLDDWDNYRKTSGLDAVIEQQFGKVFEGINTTLLSASQALGVDAQRMQTALDAYVISIGDINLRGLNGEEQAAKLSAVLSAESDKIVQAVLASQLQTINDYAQVGEGYLETVARMAAGTEEAGLALRKLGIQAVALQDVTNKAAEDIGAQILRESLVSAETTRSITGYRMTTGRSQVAIITEAVSGIGEIIATLDGSADDLASAYVSLINVRTAFGALGLAGSAVTRDLLAGAGGIDALADSLSAYEDGFATTSERLASQGAVVRDAFQRLGLSMPTTAEAFRALVRGIDTSTASGQELLGQVLGLSGGLRELLDAVQSTTSGITDEIERIRGLMSSGSTAGQSLAQLQSSFAIRAAQAKAGDSTALEGLPGASRALLDAAADMVGSRADLVRLQASTASTLQGVADAVNAAALEAASSSGAAVTTAPEVAAPAVQAVSDPALQDVLAELQSLRAAAQRQADQAAERDAQILELQQAVAAATAETARVLRDITPNGNTIAVSLEAGGL